MIDMKRIIITLLALLTLSFYSCNILTEDPKDFVSPQNFFKTEDEVTSALYGVYEKLHNIYIGDYEKIFIGDIGVDIMITRQSPRIDVYQYYLLEAPTVEYSTMWKDHYSAIGAANMVINRINASSNLKEEFKNKILGEVRFLRAFFYYNLVQLWGDVPMWLDELELEKVSALSRTPKAEVISQIITDMEFAASNLPHHWELKNQGRVTKWCAKAMLSRICLLENQWQKAYDLSKEIIQSSPHKLLTNYNDIFNWKNKFNDELIFIVPSLTDIKGSQIHSFTNPRGRDESNKVATAFAEGKTALRPDGVSVSSSTQLFQGWGMFNSTKNLLASYEDGDKRKEIMDWHSLTLSDGSIVTFDGGDGGGTGHYTLKWMAFDEKANNGSRDIHQIRLGEIYLILAEAANELNQPNEAIEALNKLRERAFGDNAHNYASTLSKEEIKKAIVNENKWELAGEGVRRWYLIHWGYDYLYNAVQALKNENPQAANNIKPHHILFKIPEEEFIKNPNLGNNNPGY